ncbi:MAG: biotin--[acetyl-CoA-carboxylase] ligase [Nitrospiraceae bacterium]|nr:biotin--[acetyl-CoA-carboxylase] ligase [Nitrospiraceae bacterium]
MASNGPDSHFPPLSSDVIQAGIRGGIWERLLFFDSVDSTNQRGLALPASDLPDQGAVLIAESQTSGRGRRGRNWISTPYRNIYLSAIFSSAALPDDATLLSLLAAVSGAWALRITTGLEVRVKWPNDLMVNNRKIGGILSELRFGSGRPGRAVIGIGINVNSEAGDFPEELREVATSVRVETGDMGSREGIIIEVLKQLEAWHGRLMAEGGTPVLKEWKRLSSTLGKKVRVALADEVVSGIAEAIDEGGMLIVRPRSGESRRISAGDVTELR